MDQENNVNDITSKVMNYLTENKKQAKVLILALSIGFVIICTCFGIAGIIAAKTYFIQCPKI